MSKKTMNEAPNVVKWIKKGETTWLNYWNGWNV